MPQTIPIPSQEIDVRAYSNAEEVDLLLNVQSLGRQAMPPFSELKWKVKYAPGVLAATAASPRPSVK